MDFKEVKTITDSILSEAEKRIVGNKHIMKKVLLALYSNGHVLLEGVPGISKTLMASTLAEIIGMNFKRVQFTPDLMPSDILGVNVFNQKTTEFEFLKGPIFTNFLLCDEINRAPPKTQSALLEAMQEKQVTVEGTSYTLPEPFFVIATQNPIEQAGTYPLPEAQMDRFIMRLLVSVPPKTDEIEILRLKNISLMADVSQVTTRDEIQKIQEKVLEVNISDKIMEYIVDLVTRTRGSPSIDLGASPRASIAMLLLSKANAAAAGRDYVQPDDVKYVAFEVLNHRIILSHEAELERLTPDQVVKDIISSVEVVT